MSSVSRAQLAIIAAYLFAFLATLFVLLFGATFTKGQRSRYPLLRRLDGKQVRLAIIAVACMFISYGAYAWKDLLFVEISLELAKAPNGQPIERGTLGSFRHELAHESDLRSRRAEEAFEAGELAFKAERYAEASREYLRSLDELPTMSGFLNAGISLWYVADFIGAKQSLTQGLSLAKQHHDEAFEATYLNGLGILAAENGDNTEAEAAFTELLRRFGAERPAVKANVLNNLGAVYIDQGRFKDAVGALTLARDLFIAMKNRQGEAKTMFNLAAVRQQQGAPDEATAVLEAACQIFEAEGNRLGLAQCKGEVAFARYNQGNYLACLETASGALALSEATDDMKGQARTLHILGLCRLKLGRRGEALRAFRQANFLYEITATLSSDAIQLMGDLRELEAMMPSEQGDTQDVESKK